MTRRMVILIILSALAATAVLWRPDAAPAQAAAPYQTGELLTNPGLEGDANMEYPRIATSEGGGAVAAGWSAWWYNDAGDEYSVPEYEVAKITGDAKRVHGGNTAQQLFRPWVHWLAGIYQQVEVPANARLRFTLWGHAWATMCTPPHWKEGDPPICDANRDSHWGVANPTHMKIGIDPTGGTNWSSSNVVWSPEVNALDYYTQFVVEAQAQGTTVTVFAYTTFDWPAPINAAYWDDASLTVVGQPPAVTPVPPTHLPSSSPALPTSAPSGSRPLPVPTQPAEPDGSQYHTVRAGETLFGIALAYGVTTQQIRDLNGLMSEMVYTGQRLLIWSAPAVPPTAASAAVTPLPDATGGTSEATPQGIADATQTGKLCVAMFQDMNHDGLRDLAETLVAGGSITLAGPASNVYTTDGQTEPFCFSDLPAGDYTLSVTAPSGYSLVSAQQVPITVTGGSEVVLSFGVEQVAPLPMADETGSKGAWSRISSPIVIVGGIGAVLLLASVGGLAAYFFIFRKRTTAG